MMAPISCSATLLRLAESAWASTAPELNRALYALKVLLRAYLVAEEVALTGFSTEPGKGHAS